MQVEPHPRVVFVFLDGVGLGAPEPEHNPFAALRLPAFEGLAGGQPWTAEARAFARPDHVFRAIDACLGVDGLPQSGTGQATLFTGVNGAALAGRHYGPYPHSATRGVIARDNVFARVRRRFADHPEPAVFANAYPPRFFAYAGARDRWTVTTRCCLDAGIRIRTAEDVVAGRALTAELTGRAWREQLGLDVPLLDEAEAGARLAGLAAHHAFTLFEFFLTDKAGHSRSPERAADVLAALDRFFAGLVGHLDFARDLLVVTSDHGNLEDLSTKTHTRNPVPLVARGPGAARFAGVEDLSGVTPAIMAAYDEAEGAPVSG